jgi:hypothetical protein
MRHLPVKDQVDNLNVLLRGHYAYFGIAGNFRALHKVHRAVERYWHKMLCSRSWKGRIRWQCSIRSGRNLRCCDQSSISHTGSCKLSLCCEPTSEERSAGNPHATFRGSRRRVTASGHPVLGEQSPEATRPRMLPLPLIEGRVRDPVPANLTGRRPSFLFAQDCDDLFLAEPAQPHLSVSLP